jgi:hypothetical protein
MTPREESDHTTLGESVVDEVRAIREAIDEDVGHDMRRLADRARRAGEEVRRQYGLKAAQPFTKQAGSESPSPRG